MKKIVLENYLFKPAYAESPPKVPDDAAILIGTPVGSLVVDRKGGLADTGVRAQKLADSFGAHVLAYQDLGPNVPLSGLLSARRRLAHKIFQNTPLNAQIRCVSGFV